MNFTSQLFAALYQIIHLDVGRASARHVGLKPDLQPIDFAMPQELMNYLGLWHRTNQISNQPGYKVILPWSLRRKEMIKQLAYIREWGAQFVTAIPELGVQ